MGGRAGGHGLPWAVAAVASLQGVWWFSPGLCYDGLQVVLGLRVRVALCLCRSGRRDPSTASIVYIGTMLKGCEMLPLIEL